MSSYQMSITPRVLKHKLPFPRRSRALLCQAAGLAPTLGPSLPLPWERSVVSALQSSGRNSSEDHKAQKRFPLSWIESHPGVFISCHKADFFLGSLMVRIFTSLGENHPYSVVSFLASPHPFFLADFWSLESGSLGIRGTQITEMMKGGSAAMSSSPVSKLCMGKLGLHEEGVGPYAWYVVCIFLVFFFSSMNCIALDFTLRSMILFELMF